MKVQHINQFLFDSATYNISDKNGCIAQLMVNYKENKYIIRNTKKLDKRALEEVATIATSLLQRKSGVNIAEHE